jgi:hypothetical protein
VELDNTEKRKRPFSSDRQKRLRLESPVLTFQAETFWPRSWAVELDNKKSGSARLAPTDRKGSDWKVRF